MTDSKPRADDLIPEENATVQLALKRLPPKEAYDRVFRLRRAFQVHSRARPRLCSAFADSELIQCSLAHQLLPVSEHTLPEDVRTYPVLTRFYFPESGSRTNHISHRSLRKSKRRRRSESIWSQWSLRKRSSAAMDSGTLSHTRRQSQLRMHEGWEEPVVVSPAVSILYIREELKLEIAC
jgi:homospermidine synthase